MQNAHGFGQAIGIISIQVSSAAGFRDALQLGARFIINQETHGVDD